METAKHIIIVLALALFMTGVATSAEKQISNTRQAGCVIQIIVNSDNPFLNPENIDGLIHSSGIMGRAIQEVLDSAPPDGIKIVVPAITRSGSKESIIYNFDLKVQLSENVKPLAAEFLRALVQNLDISLNNAYAKYLEDFIVQLNTATHIYEIDEKNLEQAQKNNESKKNIKKYIITYSDLSEADIKIYKQLDTQVDLSKLSPYMTIKEVFEIMSHSVEPALQFQPNWKDLADNADILPTTPCEMDSLKSIKIGKAIEILMTNLSSGLATIDYIVQGGVVVIATRDKLPNNLETTVYDVSGLISPSQSINSIKSSIEKTIEPDSWYDSSDIGEGKIDVIVGNQLSIHQTPEIQQKIQGFLDSIPVEKTIEPLTNISPETLINEKQDLIRQKRLLELEIARLDARQTAAEQRIIAVSSKIQDDNSVNKLKQELRLLEYEVSNSNQTDKHPEVIKMKEQIAKLKEQIASENEKDAITIELEQLIQNQTQQLAVLRQQVEVGQRSSNELAEAEAKLVQAKIQLARRREELAKSVGVEQLSTLNENLSMTILDLAEKKAEFKVIEKQLSEIESQIKATSIVDPNVLKIRQARKALEEAEKRVNEWKTTEANLQPPQVIAIGIE